MKKKRKICVVTSTRADYGLLTPLLHQIDNDKDLKLQIVATAMHLSSEFGNTYQEIEKKFIIDKKVETLLSSDSAIGINKTMGLTQISFTEIFDELKPDIIVILGDRYEILSVAVSAMIMKIPIAHLSGGELTFGALDDSIRHAITKISHIHFVATEEYRKRVIQLGEPPENVYNFGEVGLDNIKDLKLMTKTEFEKSINFKLNKRNLLITYHPTTLESIKSTKKNFQSLLSVLDKLENTNLIFTKSNADEGGRMINKMIDIYVSNNQKAIAVSSLGRLKYLSALQYVDAVVGNTSSGIVEAPSFKIGTINIGRRQSGRIQAKNVINTKANKKNLIKAFKKLFSEEFQRELKNIKNPYYKDGNASYHIKEILKKVNLKKIINKKFYDI